MHDKFQNGTSLEDTVKHMVADCGTISKWAPLEIVPGFLLQESDFFQKDSGSGKGKAKNGKNTRFNDAVSRLTRAVVPRTPPPHDWRARWYCFESQRLALHFRKTQYSVLPSYCLTYIN